jgi:putative peptidoglycan lipid II flippase
MLSNVLLNIIFGYYFDHVGLAVATSISALINASLLYFYLKKQSIFYFSKDLIKIFFKVLIASLIMAVFILNFDKTISIYLDANAIFRMITLASTIGLSIIIYFLSLKLLGINLRKL